MKTVDLSPKRLEEMSEHFSHFSVQDGEGVWIPNVEESAVIKEALIYGITSISERIIICGETETKDLANGKCDEYAWGVRDVVAKLYGGHPALKSINGALVVSNALEQMYDGLKAEAKDYVRIQNAKLTFIDVQEPDL